MEKRKEMEIKPLRIRKKGDKVSVIFYCKPRGNSSRGKSRFVGVNSRPVGVKSNYVLNYPEVLSTLSFAGRISTFLRDYTSIKDNTTRIGFPLDQNRLKNGPIDWIIRKNLNRYSID
jgi:hypothetical protein